jgi:hypothetical protein
LGPTQLDDLFTQPVITADDVHGDTPSDEDDFLPDAEREDDESDVGESGRYTKRAKAQHRA